MHVRSVTEGQRCCRGFHAPADGKGTPSVTLSLTVTSQTSPSPPVRLDHLDSRDEKI